MGISQQNNVAVIGLSVKRLIRNTLKDDELQGCLWSPKTGDHSSFRAVTDSDLQTD